MSKIAEPTNEELIADYKHVYFRINDSVYKWGVGYIISHEAIEDFEKDIDKMIALLGMKRKHEKRSSMSAITGVNGYEQIYFHPMGFSGSIHKDNIEKYTKILKEFKSKYFNWRGVDVYEFRDNMVDYYIKGK